MANIILVGLIFSLRAEEMPGNNGGDNWDRSHILHKGGDKSGKSADIQKLPSRYSWPGPQSAQPDMPAFQAFHKDIRHCQCAHEYPHHIPVDRQERLFWAKGLA